MGDEDLEDLKEDVANDLGVDLAEGEDLTAAEAGSVGGQMVKRLIQLGKKELKEENQD